MIVDDSLVIRTVVTHWLMQEPDIEVVAEARTGREALDRVVEARPDVILLDIEMPEMDGLSALPELLRRGDQPVVIIISSASQHQASATLRALHAGAVDYVAKPQGTETLSGATDFRDGLIERIRLLGRSSSLRGGAGKSPTARPVPITPRQPAIPEKSQQPRALVIGASTGGPQALGELLPRLVSVIDRIPVLVVQHMPAAFSQRMAEHIAANCGRPAHVATSGEVIRTGRIYLAPGDRHMEVTAGEHGEVVVLNDAPPENFCRPSVDRLFVSAAQVWGVGLFGLVLTGMGHDGGRGARAIAKRGGVVFAQDEASSVVWGMPGAAVETGGCLAVLTLREMADVLAANVAGGAA